MDHQVKSILQEPKQLNKPKQSKPAKPLPKRKSEFNETIAVTRDEVAAIIQVQRRQRMLRLLEVEDILLREIERCRRLTQQKQD